MADQYGVGQVAKRSVIPATEVMLAIRLDGSVSVFGDVGCIAVRAFDVFRPSKLVYHLITFGIIDQSVNVESHSVFSEILIDSFTQISRFRRHQPDIRVEPSFSTPLERPVFEMKMAEDEKVVQDVNENRNKKVARPKIEQSQIE